MQLGEDEVFLARKIRLLPTKEQEELFWKSAGVARWAYNFYLSENKMVYEYTGKHVSGNEIRKVINNVLKPNTHTWLKEVSSNVMKQAVKDAENNLKRFFKGLSKYPEFKSKHKSKPSFYVNYESLHSTKNGFHGERLGDVKTSEPLPILEKGQHFLDPRITYDGRFWYLSVHYKSKKFNIPLTDEVLGIDLGIKSLAVVSNKDNTRSKVYANINKSKEVKRLKRKLKHEQRKHSKKLLVAKQLNRDLEDCKNLEKQRKKVNSVYKRLTNIRTNYIHQITTEIVKIKPSKVVMEDLKVSEMLKNKYLVKYVLEQDLRKFRNILKYKCNVYNIEFILADRYYASSKICSQCGNVKHDLKLSDRIYKCEKCGLVINRDLNASINLANYNS